jgi:hypothetical protein
VTALKIFALVVAALVLLNLALAGILLLLPRLQHGPAEGDEGDEGGDVARG